jgi:glycosyltransferase involved in cell wall biosynthesis
MRYIWHMKDAYFSPKNPVKKLALAVLLKYLRWWDRMSAERVTHFIAISKTVQQRIRECYDRDSVVIYPPADTAFYCPAKVRRDEYYLILSAFAPYKRIDLAIEACNRLNKHLLIIGTGQDEAKLKAMAGPTIRFAGWQSDEVIRDHLRRCRALLFPGEEDYGIVPVEANACGTPVIAFGRGGATETIVPLDTQREPTGVWFAEQNGECLVDAIQLCESRMGEISPTACRRQSLRFTRDRFESEIMSYLGQVMGTTVPVPLRSAA